MRRGVAKRADFEATALPHLNSLYGVAYRLTYHAGDAEDLIQETLLRAYRFWDGFQRDSNCRAWLFKILTNTFLSDYQKRKRCREVLTHASAEQQTTDGVLVQERSMIARDPYRTLLDQALSADVSAALHALPDDFRLAVVLCDVQGFSYQEIADIMECPVGTVMSRLYRGRRQLKKSLTRFAVSEGLIRPPQECTSASTGTIDLDSYRKRRLSG